MRGVWMLLRNIIGFLGTVGGWRGLWGTCLTAGGKLVGSIRILMQRSKGCIPIWLRYTGVATIDFLIKFFHGLLNFII